MTTVKRKYQARRVIPNLRSVAIQLNINKLDGNYLKIGNT
jgi:hypothetical protein